MAKNDEVIKELMAKVEAQTKELGTRPRGTWVTNGVFKYAPNDYFNINVVQDFSILAKALGFLLTNQIAFDNACKRLGIRDTTFKWEGYSLLEWEEDFKMRIAIVHYDQKKKLLEATKTKLQGLVSEEEKTAMELGDIAKLLG